MPDGALNSLLWFAFVLVLIPVALWLLKRSPLGGGGTLGKHKLLRSVAVLPLSSTQRIVTVEVGSGVDRKWLVLGVTAHQISTLHTLPPQEPSPADAAL
jgi:flagellar protein FliO/FliZ